MRGHFIEQIRGSTRYSKPMQVCIVQASSLFVTRGGGGHTTGPDSARPTFCFRREPTETNRPRPDFVCVCAYRTLRSGNVPHTLPRSGELRTQKLKSHLVRTQSLNVLPLKPGVGQYIAIHAKLTARDFFLAYFYTSGPFTCIFFQNLSRFFPVLAVANTWFLCRPAE